MVGSKLALNEAGRMPSCFHLTRDVEGALIVIACNIVCPTLMFL